MNKLQNSLSGGNRHKNLHFNMELQKKRLKKELTRNMLHRFYIESALYAFGIIFLFAVGYYVCSQKIWYESTPFYDLVHWLHYKWFEVFLIFFAAGLLFLTFRYFRKFIWILEYILNEVEQMANEPEGVAQNNTEQVPTELTEVHLQIERIREQMEQNRLAAKEAEKRKNDLIVYMAHALKTPLTSVIGYLNLLHDEQEISSKLQEKYLGIALHKAERLEDLINEFFEITRLQLSNLVLQKSKVNLGRMLEQIAYEFRPQLMEKQIEYELHLEPGLEINCDIDKIERVFDNLLKNAFHYSYEQSTIHISTYQETIQKPDGWKPAAAIQFDNRGKTIPAEKLSQIFEQFFRMDHSRASYSGGAGLGLAIAKEIIEAHGGTINCTSEQEHICFKIVLPF